MPATALTPNDVVPPAALKDVFRVSLTGLTCCGIAGTVGAILINQPHLEAANTFRLIAVAVGVLAAGSAVALRPDQWKLWAIAAAAAGAAYLGLPPQWDSARLLVGVLAALAASGTLLVLLPRKYRLALGTVVVLFHFGGILTATTQPDPAPWLSTQVYSRVYHPYLTFTYMRNAYHFYSPEPGPASQLFVLIQYELDEVDPKTGSPKIVHEWLYLPRRDTNMKDPLALTYYRRLSIAEMTNGSIPDLFTPQSFEKLDAHNRRREASFAAGGKEPIPFASPDIEPEYQQYRVPRPDISRYILPSYAKHLHAEYSAPGREVKTVKLYRLEHRVVTVQSFAKGTDPYHPILYRAYYLGEYDKDGHLTNPEDPMLYWLVPVVPKAGGPSPNDPLKRDYEDYLSKHAGFQVDWRRP